MVNSEASSANAAERALALSYALPPARAALDALLALDARLASIVRVAREPIVGQMRLTWWYEALLALDRAPPPAEPILRNIASAVLNCGVAGADLARMVDGWEVLLPEATIDPEALMLHAEARGATLFAAAGQGCGCGDARLRRAGQGWALADIATHISSPVDAASTRASARTALADLFDRRWPRALRPLGAMTLSARFDVMPSPPPPSGPRRVARLAWHRLNGT